MSAKLVPAILTNNKGEYLEQLKIVRQLTNRVQIDIIDQELIDNQTIQPQDLLKQNELDLDLHLMVADPLKYVRMCIALYPYTMILMYECNTDIRPALEAIKKAGLRAGLAINPETTVKEITPLIELLDHVLVMGYPAGFAGQKFQRSVLSKAEELKALKPSLEIGLDGGVGESTIKPIIKANFDVINVNSYLFKNSELSPMNAYMKLIGEV